MQLGFPQTQSQTVEPSHCFGKSLLLLPGRARFTPPCAGVAPGHFSAMSLPTAVHDPRRAIR